MALNPGKSDCNMNDGGLASELHQFFIKQGRSDSIEIPIIDPKTGAQVGSRTEDSGLQSFCYSLAITTLDHIKKNMEIIGIKTTGDVNASVNGSTGAAGADNHQHPISLASVQQGTVFIQNNDGPGHVK